MTGVDWSQIPMIAFDTETTGTDVFTDRIVQAALVKIVPGQEPVTRTYLVDPGIPIPDEAAAVHGITTEHARTNATHTIVEALSEVSTILARSMHYRWPIVAANAAYDLSLLETELARHQIPSLANRVAPLPVGPVIDPMVLDRHVDKYRKGSRKLTDLANHYGIELGNAHDAGADALAAGLLVPKILGRFPEKFEGLTLGGLHQAQVVWRREQMDSLRAYFDRNGTVHDGCSGEWPIRTAPPAQPVEPSTATTQGVLIP